MNANEELLEWIIDPSEEPETYCCLCHLSFVI